jgi:hypothetical protein
VALGWRLGLWAVGAWLFGCSGGGSNEDTVHTVAGVCLPAEVPAGRSFGFRLTGGCGGGSDAYTCRVLKGAGTVEVTLVGPAASGSPCETYNKPCQVAALSEGPWAFQFTGNEDKDRTVNARNGAVDPVCDTGQNPDGGTPP